MLSFPRDEIVEIIPASYNNEARRLSIPDLPQEMIPGSPEDIQIPVPPSGTMTPLSGLGSPNLGPQSPREGARSPRLGSGSSEPGDGTLRLIERAMRRT